MRQRVLLMLTLEWGRDASRRPAIVASWIGLTGSPRGLWHGDAAGQTGRFSVRQKQVGGLSDSNFTADVKKVCCSRARATVEIAAQRLTECFQRLHGCQQMSQEPLC